MYTGVTEIAMKQSDAKKKTCDLEYNLVMPSINTRFIVVMYDLFVY